jgi:hypothetical protein
MKNFSALLAIILMATPAVLSAAAFEGKVQMTMTDAKGRSVPMELWVKDGFVRAEMDTGKGEKMAMITDEKKQEMITLMPGQNMYMTIDLKGVAERVAKSSNEGSFEKTGETQKILGYTCTKYIFKSKDGTSEIWATEDLGKFVGTGLFGGGRMGGKRSAASIPAWQKALMEKDLFTLRVVSLNPKGKKQFRLDVVKIEKGPQADALFAPPPGAQKFSFGGMMKGLGLPGMKR